MYNNLQIYSDVQLIIFRANQTASNIFSTGSQVRISGKLNVFDEISLSLKKKKNKDINII